MRLAEPWWLLVALLLLMPSARSRAAAPFSHLPLLEVRAPPSWRLRAVKLLPWLRRLWLLLLVVALARPQAIVATTFDDSRGPALMILLDRSGSMGLPAVDAMGQVTTRLDQARRWIDHLLRQDSDPIWSATRVGLIAFATVAEVVCPLSTDRDLIGQAIQQIEIDAIDNRTDIGLALAVAIDRLGAGGGSLHSAQVVLITDGAQRILEGPGPLGGARIAQALGVRIHVVDVGPQSGAETQEQRILRHVAQISGGRYENATTPSTSLTAHIGSLAHVAARPAMQQTWAEMFPILVLAALAVLLVETTLRTTWLRVFPE